MVVIVLGGRLDVRFCARDGGASGTGQISLSLSRLGISFSAGDLGIAMYDATPSLENMDMLWKLTHSIAATAR